MKQYTLADSAFIVVKSLINNKVYSNIHSFVIQSSNIFEIKEMLSNLMNQDASCWYFYPFNECIDFVKKVVKEYK